MRQEEEGEKGYWGGIVEQYQPTPGVSWRKDHNGDDSTKLEKEDLPGCHCQQKEQYSGRVTEIGGAEEGVDELELAEWRTRHSRNKKKKKWDVGWGRRKRSRREKREIFIFGI